MWGVLFLGFRELPASCFRELSRSFGPTPRQVRGSQVGTFLPKVGTSWGVLPATRNRPTHTQCFFKGILKKEFGFQNVNSSQKRI